VLERLWALPTFEIHGVLGGFTGEGAKTVIPAAATAKVSMRLVPNQKLATVERQLAAGVQRLRRSTSPPASGFYTAPIRRRSRSTVWPSSSWIRPSRASRGGGPYPRAPAVDPGGAGARLSGRSGDSHRHRASR